LQEYCTQKSLYGQPGICMDLLLLSQLFKPLLGRSRSRGRCGAVIRLSHRPEPSGHVVHGEVDGLDIGGQHGRRFVLLRHTGRRGGHTPFVQARAETSYTGAEAVELDPRAKLKSRGHGTIFTGGLL